MGLRDWFKKLGKKQQAPEEQIETPDEDVQPEEQAKSVDALVSPAPIEDEDAAQQDEEPIEAEELNDDPGVLVQEESVARRSEEIAAAIEEKEEAAVEMKPETPEIEVAPIIQEESKDEALAEQKPEKKQGLFAKLASGLKKTTDNISSIFEGIFSGSALDDDFYEELEEALIVADVGMDTTQIILDRLREAVKEQKLTEPVQARDAVRDIVSDLMMPDTPFGDQGTVIVLVVGVNGVGKTTSIGKLSAYYKAQGKQVMLAAADTFRAAATEQLVEWSMRAGVPIVKQKEGADPAAVVYDAVHSAKAKDVDMLIVDTAGRLHNKKHLMDELQKIRRVIAREFPEATVETLLVLDATTGQNGLAQARIFAETVNVTGIVLSKLDGTAKGGVAVAIKEETGIPVRFVGVGERIDDVQPFFPEEYAAALFV